jgi:cysteine desulfurase/selenocysteine lyase
MIYLDNSATSWPKPREVKEAMVRFMDKVGANPGRSGHLLSLEAARIIYDAREAIATLFGVRDPSRVIFTLNATEALNLALKGLLRPGHHVITSSMEHNSVMRPLRALEKEGVEIDIIPCSATGGLDPHEILLRVRPQTRMIVLTHASNVTGAILPIREAGFVAREHDLLFLVDAAQTAGAYPIDMERDGIDLLAFTGHKSLYGPQGTGGLVIGERVPVNEMVPLKQGGTGSRSESEEHPPFLPDRFESGTPNGVGIAGLHAGVRFVLEKGVQNLRSHEMALLDKLLTRLKAMRGVICYGPEDLNRRIATLSFNVAGLTPSEVSFRLEREYGILCRPGLHCAPAAHRTLGTIPQGTVRLSLGAFNTEEEIETCLRAISAISERPSSASIESES